MTQTQRALALLITGIFITIAFVQIHIANQNRIDDIENMSSAHIEWGN